MPRKKHAYAIWLSEQGVVFSNHGHREPAGKGKDHAQMVMRAYVDEHGKNARYQLTRLNKHVKLFDYYELRGEAESTGNQDSGLLTPSGKPRGGIFGIYRHKTR